MYFIKLIKRFLVKIGPKNPITQSFLKLHGYLKGYKIIFENDLVFISRNDKKVILSIKNYVFIPDMINLFDDTFNRVESKKIGDQYILNFSKPAVHRLKNSGIDFLFSCIVEDCSIEGYTYKFQPFPGAIVFDVGANIGSVTYFLSLMVGEKGKVYSFEPDYINRDCLDFNIKNKQLKNVTILDVALDSQSGKAIFHMDGSIAAALTKYSDHPNTGIKKEVAVLTLEDCCTRLGVIPNFIKMDIEGAEIGVIKSSLEFLKKHPIHFACETNHKTKNGTLTCYELERLFRSIGYAVESSDKFGTMFTWATPPTC